MNVEELTRDQLSEAKGMMVVDSINKGETRYADGDAMFPDDVITDEEAYAYYAATDFSEDDFNYRGLPKLTEQQRGLLDTLSELILKLRRTGIHFAKSEDTNDLYAVNSYVTIGGNGRDEAKADLSDEDCARLVCKIDACPKAWYESVVIEGLLYD